MKSIFVTLIMFAVVFGSLWLGVLDLIDNNYFIYISGLIFVMVVGYALIFIGKPTKEDFINAFKISGKQQTKKDIKNENTK